MALVMSPLGGEAASGKIGGKVYAHNRAGQYVRARTIPTNPRTAIQEAARTRFASASAAWAALTAGEKQTWANWSAAHPVLNRLGQSMVLAAVNWFVAGKTAMDYCGGTPVSNAPSGLGDRCATPVTGVTLAEGGELVAPISTLFGGRNRPNCFIVAQVASARGDGTAYLPRNYKSVGFVEGSTPTPPTTLALNTGIANIIGNRCRVRFKVVLDDLSTGPWQEFEVTVTANA